MSGQNFSTVIVGGVNEMPTCAVIFHVDENEPAGAVVGDVGAHAHDQDYAHSVALATLHLAIVDGDDGGLFALDATTGELTTTGPLDYEATASYTLTIEVTDPGGLASTGRCTVRVRDVAEPPTLADAAFAVREDAAGAAGAAASRSAR